MIQRSDGIVLNCVLEPENMDYNDLYNSLPVPFLVYSIDSCRILESNDCAEDFFGFTREELISKEFIDLFTDESFEKINSIQQAQNEFGSTIQFGIHTAKKSNGELILIQLSGRKILFSDQKSIFLVLQEIPLRSNIPQINQLAKQLMDSSQDVICSIDELGRFIEVSAASHAMWGYYPSEMVGKSYHELVLEDDLEKTNTTAEKILSGGTITNFENRYIRKDGSIAYNLWSAYWNSVDGKIHAVARDASEKRQNEEFLIESESRFKALVQEGSDLIAILDEHGFYKYVTPTSSHILGIPPEDFIGKNAFDFIHPEDAERTLESLQKISTQYRVNVEPFRFKNKEGEWRWVETILTNLLDHPSIKGIVANSRDITASKEEEQRLKLLESVILNTSDAVIITEAEPQSEPGPRILYVNEAFTKMTGYTSEEVIGKTPRILQGPKTDRAELDKLRNAMRLWQPCEVTTINYKKNGEEFWLNFKVSPVANERGWYTHWISIERNVTEKKNEEIHKELHSRISQEFSLERDLQSSLHKVCQLIIEFGDFSFCEFWLPSPNKTTLRLYSKCANGSDAEMFYSHSRFLDEVVQGEGLPGLVWNSNKVEIWDELSKNESFIRRSAAKKIGLNSIMGIPLHHEDQMVGVLLIGTKSSKGTWNRHNSILNKLVGYIGSEINRKRLEADLKHLFEALPILICLTDFAGNFIQINKTGCEILEFEESELIGKQFGSFVHPEDRHIAVNEMAKLSQGQTTFSFENRFITKSGKTVWFNWQCNSNHIEGIVYATAKNVTNEKKLKGLVDDAARMAIIGGWEIDVLKNELIWSDAVHQIYDTDPESFKPELEKVIQFFRQDYVDFVTSVVSNAIEKGISFDEEAALISAKGHQKWVRAIGKAEMFDGKCVRVSGSFQDITHIKTTQLRLESLTNDLPGVTFQYYIFPDGTDKVTGVSRASNEIWGVTPEDCERDIDLIWVQIRRGGDFDEVVESIRKSIENKTQWHSRFRIIRDNGEVRFQEGFGSPHFLPDGTVMYNSMIFDITDEKKATLLNEQTAKMAVVGSWELLLKEMNDDAMYWSPVVKEILEVGDDFKPTLSNGMYFYAESDKSKIETCVYDLIEKGIPFDDEFRVRTAKGKLKWVRCIGNGDFFEGECIRIYGSTQDITERKNLDERLNEILRSITDGFYAIDENWNFTFFNKEAENLLKRQSRDLIGKNIWEEFPEAKGTDLQTLYEQVSSSGIAQSFDYYYPGDGCWYEVNAYPSSGGIASYFKNIDEKRRASEDLKKAFDEKNRILESIGDAFFAVDNNWIVTYWNNVAQYVLGKPKEQILGKNLWVEYADAIDSDFYREYHRAKETGEVVSFEEYYPTLKKWFEVTAYPSDNGLSVYFKDITMRKETDIQILQANERFEKVTQATTDAIWDWDIENDTFYRGEGFEKLFGYKVNRTLHDRDFWKDSFHPDDLPQMMKSLEGAIVDETKDLWQMEYRIIHSGGEIKTVVDKGMIIRNEQRKAIRMVGAITDISERKRYESELQELNESLKKYAHNLELTNEQLEQFAYIASHDLQEPLRMIYSFLNQLQRKYHDQLDEKAQQYIFFATDGAKRMKQIILDLLEYSRAGKQNETTEFIDLNLLMEEFILLRRKIIEEKNVKIEFVDLPKVKCYKAPLIQTIHCLMDNAIKYTRDNVQPSVQVLVTENTKNWIVQIKDIGIGIEPQFFDKIFIIFQRLHNRDEYGGTGIGLSIAKKNVESWGGKIWLESTPGEGSSFYFTIKKL